MTLSGRGRATSAAVLALPKCTLHGLPKATTRRMAELETANASMKAVSSHTKDHEVARYMAATNQAPC
jgi:hypothetical protein